MLTKNIQLNSHWQKKYRITQFFMVVLFLLAITYYAYKILFPSEFYEYSAQGPNNNDNSITGMSQSHDSITFNAIPTQDFSTVKISIKTKKGSQPLNEENIITTKKSHLALFYPQGEDITDADLDGYEINSLVSEGISVFIVGNGKKYPINNPQTFVAHGFKWENIKSSEDVDLSSFEKQKLFTIRSPHPAGTVFKVTGKEKYFFIKDGTKHELKGEALKIPNLEKASIPMEEKIEIQGSCAPSKNILGIRKYQCQMTTEQINNLLVKNYRFNIESTTEEIELEKIKIQFKRTIDFNNLKLSLGEIKDKIIMRYQDNQ